MLVTGGYNETNDSTRTSELYNPSTGTWAFTIELNDRRYLHTATVLSNGEVLAVGGFGGPSSILSSAELYEL